MFDTGKTIALDPEADDEYQATFAQPVSATHIRIYPLTTIDDGNAAGQPAEMRFEIHGCRGKYKLCDIRRVPITLLTFSPASACIIPLLEVGLFMTFPPSSVLCKSGPCSANASCYIIPPPAF